MQRRLEYAAAGAGSAQPGRISAAAVFVRAESAILLCAQGAGRRMQQGQSGGSWEGGRGICGGDCNGTDNSEGKDKTKQY